jgi:cupin fold WbuC family metalloprotein
MYPPKDEAFVVLQGWLYCVIFSEKGEIQTVHRLEANSTSVGIDIVGSIFHTLITIKPDTVIFEVKSGPFEKVDERDFAEWSPQEGTKEAGIYWDELIKIASNLIDN